jgi:hypothetical protein
MEEFFVGGRIRQPRQYLVCMPQHGFVDSPSHGGRHHKPLALDFPADLLDLAFGHECALRPDGGGLQGHVGCDASEW